MLATIRGHIRKQPQFVLGLHGVFDSVPENYLDAVNHTIWEAFQAQLSRSIEEEWEIRPIRFDAVKTTKEAPTHSRKDRYDQMKSVGEWKQHRLSLVDLDIHDCEVASQFGRHCDGVILVLAAGRSAGANRIEQLRKHNIPWLGYWNLEVQSLPQLQKVG